MLQEQAAALLNLNETHTWELSFKASPRYEDGLRSGSLLREKTPPQHHPATAEPVGADSAQQQPRGSQEGSSGLLLQQD